LRYGVYHETIVPLAKKAPVPSFVTAFLEHLFGYMADLEEDLEGAWRSVWDLDSHGRTRKDNHLRVLGIGNEVKVAESPLNRNRHDSLNEVCKLSKQVFNA
jgi:hypothetical protein